MGGTRSIALLLGISLALLACGSGDGASGGQCLDRRQRQPCRWMQAGPEGHPGIEREHDVAGLAAVTPPGRPDDEPPADPEDREVGLAGVGPILLVDDPRLERADRPQPERRADRHAPLRQHTLFLKVLCSRAV